MLIFYWNIFNVICLKNVVTAIIIVINANYIILSFNVVLNCSVSTLLSICLLTKSNNNPSFQGNILATIPDTIVIIIVNRPNGHLFNVN